MMITFADRIEYNSIDPIATAYYWFIDDIPTGGIRLSCDSCKEEWDRLYVAEKDRLLPISWAQSLNEMCPKCKLVQTYPPWAEW